MRIEAKIDAQRRVVVLQAHGLEITPPEIVVPFMLWKDITAGVLQVEVAAELAVTKRQSGLQGLVSGPQQ